MIQSVTSNSGYTTATSYNHHWKKMNLANAEKDTTISDLTASTSTDSSTVSDEKALSLEDLFLMMQNDQRSASIPEAEETQTDSTLGSIDADGDGTLSTDEFDALMSQLGITNAPDAEDFFAQFDTNGDGEITSTEMDANKPMGPPPMGMPPMGGQEADEFFSKYDTNSDGEITADELTTAASQAESASRTDSATTAELSEEFKQFAAKVMQAYETNYQYMYGSDGASA